MPKSTPAEAALARGRPRSAPTQFPQAAAPSRTAEGRASDRSVAPSRPPAGSAARLRSSLPTRAILGPARKEDAGRNRTDTQGPRSGAGARLTGAHNPPSLPRGEAGGSMSSARDISLAVSGRPEFVCPRNKYRTVVLKAPAQTNQKTKEYNS